MWLKITIPNAFIGSDVVDWLYNHVGGFQDRRDARKYATQMLKQGFIRHTVNKSSFSEQCYYVMAPHILELCGNLSSLQLEDFDSVSEAERGGTPCGGRHLQMGSPNNMGGHPNGPPPSGYYQGPPYMMGGVGGNAYAPPPLGYTPMPYLTGNYGASYGVLHGAKEGDTFRGAGFHGGSQGSLVSGSASTNSADSHCGGNARKEAKLDPTLSGGEGERAGLWEGR